ncbi:MAG TPA: nitrate reductase cytochrome c-type subunit [Usitatibacter sp.]|nr:nitrate reductase cytochrome c-type subunit [Usitatibacter sp.]
MKRVLALMLLGASLVALAQTARENPTSPGLGHGLRGPAPLTVEPAPPAFPKIVNDDQRKTRNYPMQPPLIPHQIDNYQVDLRFNKCMDCHSRQRVGESGAPMVSITHFIGRDGEMLGEISPRRYFCTGCHVVQTDAKLPVKNTFVDFYNVQAVGGKTGDGPQAKKPGSVPK